MMKFACAKCGRTDEIVGDQHPVCLNCASPLVRATENYKGLWMSPKFAINRMALVVEKYGLRKAERSGRFKREREAWTSAVWALGLAEVTEREYWIEVETVEQTPDTKVHYLDQSAGHNHVMTCYVEVVDWEEHVPEPVQVIRRKCERAYPDSFVLLVLGRSGKVVEADRLIEEVRAIRVPFWEIWLLGCPSVGLVNMTRLHPSSSWIQFDILQALRKTRPSADVLTRLSRGRDTEFKNLGSIYMPIP